MTGDTETTTLLVHNVPDVSFGTSVSVSTGHRTWLKIIREEIAELTRYLLPAFGSQLLEFSFLTVSILSIGHTSAVALSAVSLGTLTANVTAFTLMQGFSAALDTMLPSAWTSSQPHLVGLWCQRMIVLMGFLMIPMYGLWFNMEAIFLLVKQDPEVARLSSLYLRWLSLGLPAYAFNCVSRRYFQCQGRFGVPTLINAIVASINVFLNFILVWGPPAVRLGFIGAPIATAISYNLVSILSIAYATLFLPSIAWFPPSMRMFSNLRILVTLGATGAAQTAAEWFALEITAVAASRFGRVTLAAQSVLLTFTSMFYQVFAALSVVTAIRIGNLLGEANHMGAKVAAHASLVMTLAICAVITLTVVVFKQYWAYIFTQDPDVAKLVTSVVIFVGVYQIFDAISVVLAGILRARGKQMIGALLYLSAYYAIGVPSGIYLAFCWALELRGVWLGLATGLVYTSLTGAIICLRTDWEQEVQRAMNRLKEDDNRKMPAGGNSTDCVDV